MVVNIFLEITRSQRSIRCTPKKSSIAPCMHINEAFPFI